MPDATAVSAPDSLDVRQWNDDGVTQTTRNATVAQVAGAVVREMAVSADYLSRISTAAFPRLSIAVDTALTAELHQGRLLVVTAPEVTLTGDYADLGDGFNCMVVNASGGSVIMGGMTNAVGAGRLLNGGAAGVLAFVRGVSGRVQWFGDSVE